jgi:hypothetical protein
MMGEGEPAGGGFGLDCGALAPNAVASRTPAQGSGGCGGMNLFPPPVGAP